MGQHNRPTAMARPKSKPQPAKVAIGRHEPRADDVRKRITHLAARLIAEGLKDYQAAKLKAARQLGVTNGRALPDNHQIEIALREHIALFAHDTHPRALSDLRYSAIRVMVRLAQFSPWLVGAVLNGTANEFSDIELELIGVAPKDFEMYLLNAGIAFELCDTHYARRVSPAYRQPTPKYRLEFDVPPITITLYEHHSARQSAHPRGSIRYDRAQRADAERRFQEESAKSQQTPMLKS